MSTLTDDPLALVGLLVGGFLIVAALGTLLTAPWQWYGSTTVTVLRILGTIGMLLIGVGLLYVAWGAEWMAKRNP